MLRVSHLACRELKVSAGMSALTFSIKSLTGSEYMLTFDFRTAVNNKHQIRLSPFCVRNMLLFSSVCLFGAMLIREDKVFYVAAALGVLCYSLLAARYDKLEYDDTGITQYSLLGKPFFEPWSNILCVEIREEPLISKQFLIGRVLRIECANRHSLTSYRFPYRYYTGIDDFYSFFLMIRSQNSA